MNGLMHISCWTLLSGFSLHVRFFLTMLYKCVCTCRVIENNSGDRISHTIAISTDKHILVSLDGDTCSYCALNSFFIFQYFLLATEWQMNSIACKA